MLVTPSLSHCSNKYKLAREGEKDKGKGFFFFFFFFFFFLTTSLGSQVVPKEMSLQLLLEDWQGSSIPDMLDPIRVYIRAAPLIVNKCYLDSNTHAILFLNDNDSAMSIMTFTSRVSGFVAAHVNESEVRPSSRFRCECCHMGGNKTRTAHTNNSTNTRFTS